MQLIPQIPVVAVVIAFAAVGTAVVIENPQQQAVQTDADDFGGVVTASGCAGMIWSTRRRGVQGFEELRASLEALHVVRHGGDDAVDEGGHTIRFVTRSTQDR